MPVSYQIPPWVRGADPIGKRLQAYAIGLQAAQAQARLAIERQQLQHQANQMAQQAQMEQMRLQIAQQEQERKRAHDDQQLEVLKEYHRQQGDLEQQKLGQAEEKIKAVAAMTAHKYHAQEAVQNDYKRLMAEDPTMTPEKAIVRATLMHATELGLPEAGIGSLAKAAMQMNAAPFIPGPVKGQSVLDTSGNEIPGMIAVPGMSGKGMSVRDIPKIMGEGSLANPQSIAILKKTLGYNASPEQKKTLQDLSNAWMERQKKAAGLTPKAEGDIPEWAALPGEGPEGNPTESAPAPTTTKATQAPGLPPVGAVVGGFRFLGGDPTKQDNWDSVIQDEGALLPGEEPTYPDYAQLPGEEA